MTIHKKSVQLAGLYLIILMSISLFFSFTVYQISSQELERSVRQPGQSGSTLPRGRNLPEELRTELQLLQQTANDQARADIKQRLMLTNFAILIAGAVASYVLAERTLRPIERAAESQSRFASDASHELRTPLAIMQSEIEVALATKNLTLNEAKRILRSNLEEVQHMTRMAESLIFLSREPKFTQNQLPPKPIVAIVTHAIDRASALAKAKLITIDSAISDDIIVFADAITLTEAVHNVIDNALTYSPKHTKVTIRAQKKANMIQLIITDQGPGIPRAEQGKVFERFYRSSNTPSLHAVKKGVGLGLALAKNIITMHGGTISFDPHASNGARCIIQLPRSLPPGSSSE